MEHCRLPERRRLLKMGILRYSSISVEARPGDGKKDGGQSHAEVAAAASDSDNAPFTRTKGYARRNADASANLLSRGSRG